MIHTDMFIQSRLTVFIWFPHKTLTPLFAGI